MSRASRLQLKRASGWFAAGTRSRPTVLSSCSSGYACMLSVVCGSMAVPTLELRALLSRNRKPRSTPVYEKFRTLADGSMSMADRRHH